MTPETPATRALTPSVLASIGRGLMLPGETVFEIVVVDGELQLQPAGTWNVAGGPLRSSWVYELTLSGPSGTETRTLAESRVVHLQYAYSAFASMGRLRSARLLEHDGTDREGPGAAPGAGSRHEGRRCAPHAGGQHLGAPGRH